MSFARASDRLKFVHGVMESRWKIIASYHGYEAMEFVVLFNIFPIFCIFFLERFTIFSQNISYYQPYLGTALMFNAFVPLIYCCTTFSNKSTFCTIFWNSEF